MLTPQEEERKAKKGVLAKRAIKCLYIAVEKSVAADVDEKVSDYIYELEAEIELLKSEIRPKNNTPA